METLKIIQHNVNTWTNKRHALINIYNTLNPDIILINDHSLTDNTTLKIFNYRTIQCNRQNRHHAGVAIAYKHTLHTKIIDDFHTDMLAIQVTTRQGDIIIATSYIPPRDGYLNFIDYNHLFNRPQPVYFVGDLNANHPTLGDRSSSLAGKQLSDLIQQNKCTHLGPQFPTYISYNSATNPDKVLTNNNTFHNVHLEPGPATPSDHTPIVMTISAHPIYIPIKPRKSFHRVDWTEYKQDLSQHQVPTNPNPTIPDIDRYIDTWFNHITDTSNLHIPTINRRAVPGVKTTHRIRTLQTLHDNTLSHITTQGPSHELYRLLNSYKQQLKHEYTLEHSKSWNTIIQNLDLEDDPQKFWSSIKKLTGNRQKQTAPYITDYNGHKLNTPQEKEPHFRTHWTKIFSGIDPPNNNFDHGVISKEGQSGWLLRSDWRQFRRY